MSMDVYREVKETGQRETEGERRIGQDDKQSSVVGHGQTGPEGCAVNEVHQQALA